MREIEEYFYQANEALKKELNLVKIEIKILISS